MKEGEPKPQDEPEEKLPVFNTFKIEDLEMYVDFCKRKVTDWHDNVKPDIIVLDDASALSMGFTLKSTWETAYPNEECPPFLRFDPRVVSMRRPFKREEELDLIQNTRQFYKKGDIYFEDEKRELQRKADYINQLFDKFERFENRSDVTVLVYDEILRPVIHEGQETRFGSETTLEKAVNLVTDGQLTDVKISGYSQNAVTDALKKLGFGNIWVDNGHPGKLYYLKITKNQLHFFGDDEEGKLLLEDLKKVGQITGNKIREQVENK